MILPAILRRYYFVPINFFEQDYIRSLAKNLVSSFRVGVVHAYTRTDPIKETVYDGHVFAMTIVQPNSLVLPFAAIVIVGYLVIVNRVLPNVQGEQSLRLRNT